MKKLKAVSVIFLLCVLVYFAVSIIKDMRSNKNSEFNKNAYSTTKPSSIWVIVNKKHSLPKSYMPGKLINVGDNELLRSDAATALKQLLQTAKQQGIDLQVISGFRSYEAQTSIYNTYVAKDGQNKADTYSARPGYSEHQTGLAADLGNKDGSCELKICFANSAGGKWLADNANKYGFIIRYPSGKRDVTGYEPEPWHLRYVGKSLAEQIHNSDQTMEEFFNLPPAPDY